MSAFTSQAVRESVAIEATPAEIAASVAAAGVRLSRLFDGYLADAEATHQQFMAAGERRHRAVLNACSVAVDEAREVARTTIATLEINAAEAAVGGADRG